MLPPSDRAQRTRHRRFGFWRRSYAMVVKEFIQLARPAFRWRYRDASGDAIDVVRLCHQHPPRHLPTGGAVAGGQRPRPRSSRPGKPSYLPSPQSATLSMSSTTGCCRSRSFASKFRAASIARCRPRRSPALLVAADAPIPGGFLGAVDARRHHLQTALEHDPFAGDPHKK